MTTRLSGTRTSDSLHRPIGDAHRRGKMLGRAIQIPLDRHRRVVLRSSEFEILFNRWYLDPLFRGEYPTDAVQDRVRRGHLKTDRMPYVEDGDMDVIRSPLDYLGINYYSRTTVKAGPDGQPVGAPLVPREELTEMGWEIYPDGLTEILVRVARDYAPPEIFITENGIALPEDAPRFVDGGSRDGAARVADDPRGSGSPRVVDDPRRIAFTRDHLLAAKRAIEAGVPLRGYFHWSLMDNFEWGHGYTKRFGLVRVDFDTCERMLKRSASWYRETIAANAVDDTEVRGE